MSLPKSRSHNGPTNLRNKPQLKATWKRHSRNKGLRQFAMPRVNCQRCPGRRSVWSRRIVREVTADGPKRNPNNQYFTLKKDGSYPTRERSMSNLCRADDPRAPSERFANYLQRNSTSLKDRTKNAQEQATN
jgi:hypothetical protein